MPTLRYLDYLISHCGCAKVFSGSFVAPQLKSQIGPSKLECILADDP